MLDQIFGESKFINEIIWKRQSAHNDAKQGSKHLGRVHDTLFLYGGGNTDYFFKHLYRPYDESYLEKFYKHVESGTGRRYQLGDLGAPGGSAPSKGNPHYEFLGVTRYWRYSRERMQELYDQGLIVQTKPGAVPRFKRYLDEGQGVPVGSVWDDINPIQSQDAERLGYPTQKPLKLLERILEISSQPNDIVLDAFCGCGTALGCGPESWTAVDRNRYFPDRLPRDGETAARCLPSTARMKSFGALGAGSSCATCRGRRNNCARFRHSSLRTGRSSRSAAFPTRRRWATWALTDEFIRSLPCQLGAERQPENSTSWMSGIPIQVKQKDKVGRPDIDQFETAMLREKRTKGFFVSFEFSSDALREIDAFFRREHCIIVPLTVQGDTRRIHRKEIGIGRAAAGQTAIRGSASPRASSGSPPSSPPHCVTLVLRSIGTSAGIAGKDIHFLQLTSCPRSLARDCDLPLPPLFFCILGHGGAE